MHAGGTDLATALAKLDGRHRVAMRGGTIHTAPADGRSTDALIIDGAEILATGDEAQRIARDAGDAIPHIDLAGRNVVPGFTDAHTHLTHRGLALGAPHIDDTRSAVQVLEQVREVLRHHPPDRPLIAEGWDDTDWGPDESLTRQTLDRLTPTTPILLRRVCGHKAIGNRAALSRLALCLPGQVTRDHIDFELGVVLEDAVMLARQAMPPAPEELMAALERALEEATSLGITAVHDIGSPRALATLIACRDNNHLPLRVTFHLSRLDNLDLRLVADGRHIEDDRLRLGGIKLYLDGSVGARTAALDAPYADDAATRGLLLCTTDELADAVQRIHDHGLQIVLHAIGDRAVGQAIDALEPFGAAATRRVGHRLEHLELLPPAQLARLADSGATASMQPNFVRQWQHGGGLYEQRLGHERTRWMNRFRAVLDTGVPLMLGSDCMPPGPLAGLEGAIHHPCNEERLTPRQALAAYMLVLPGQPSPAGGAAGLRSRELTEGWPADLVVVDGNPGGGGRTSDMRVEATVLEGSTIYVAPDIE